MTDAAGIAGRLLAVRERMRAAALRAGRGADSVTLVGVTKRVAVESVVAAVRAGLRDVGENYVQEARAKLPAVRDALAAVGVAPPRWHFIGRLQRNKARDVVRDFALLETLDREQLGRELDHRAAGRDAPLEVLLQVNVSGEARKSGVRPEELTRLFRASADWANLRVVGLMAIPAPAADPEATRPAFAQLRALLEALRREPGGGELRELSMGMSADFEVAIEEGATLVRVGTAIFGAREREEHA